MTFVLPSSVGFPPLVHYKVIESNDLLNDYFKILFVLHVQYFLKCMQGGEREEGGCQVRNAKKLYFIIQSRIFNFSCLIIFAH